MFGLPTDTDVSFFVGQRLIQACFGENELILNFQGRESVSITVESSLDYIDLKGNSHRFTEFREASSLILTLLGVPIRAAKVLTGGTLLVEFENDIQLGILDDSDCFESYTIRHGETLIVV